MKKILLLLVLLSMIVACQTDNTGGDDNTNIPIVPTDFYLGADFTIDSIDGKSFTSSDKSVTYTVDKITHVDKIISTIENELKIAIDNVLKKKPDITPLLGDPISTPDKIGFGTNLTIKFPITIKENSVDTKGEYSFTIQFENKPLPWDGTSSAIPTISTDNNYYLIDNASNLAWLSDQTKVDKNIRFTNNIDMANKSFKGIKEFNGIFDGDNFSIKNLNIDRSSTTDTFALIEKITDDSTIKYLTLDKGKVTSTNGANIRSDNISAFIGSVTGTGSKKIKVIIDNSTTNLNLTSNNNKFAVVTIGGFIADASNADITITNSKNLGNIINPNAVDVIYAGGFIGRSTNNIMIDMKGSSNKGDIDVKAIASYAGGLIGNSIGDANDNISITNTYNIGNIISTYVSDPDTTSESSAGGFIGDNNGDSTGKITVENTYNTGEIKANGSTTENAYSGGLIGRNQNHPLTIKTSYSYADIAGSSYGAIIGTNINSTNTYTNNFWYMPTFPLDTIGAGTELTIDAFKLEKTFTDKSWNFENIWEKLDGALYPTLKTNPNQ